eukprot:4096858-Amphidinium_carterae.1
MTNVVTMIRRACCEQHDDGEVDMMSVAVKTVDGPYKTISIERKDETELSMYCTIQDGIVDVSVVLLSLGVLDEDDDDDNDDNDDDDDED